MARLRKEERDPVLVLRKLQKEMESHFFEMGDVIEGLLVSLLAEQNVLLVGPPGSAKTQISQFLAQAIGGEFFDQLMSKFTVPDELFGPVDIIAMKEQKTFKRVTQGTLATANIALLDEIWKASSAIVNHLLRALNERTFKDNGGKIKLPLKMAIGASNEYPQGEETSAIFDRFNLKYETSYIEEDSNFMALLDSPDEDPIPNNTITLAELEQMIKEAKNLPVPNTIKITMKDMRRALKKDGIILSPRRWKKAIRFLKAKAYLRKSSSVGEDDLSFLNHVLWNHPEQRSVVIKLIAQVINPLMQKALEQMDIANEVWKNLDGKTGSTRNSALIEARLKFAGLRKKLEEFKVQGSGKSTTKIDEIYNKISQYQRQVADEILGGTI